MAERKRVGLIYFYNESWIAGAYYILNIIHALNYLKDSRKPILVILTDDKKLFEDIKKQTNYMYLEFVNYPFLMPKHSLFERLINKLSRIVINKNVVNKIPEYPIVDFVYPYQIPIVSDNLKKVNWIPDFQEDYLPQYFSETELNQRKKNQKEVLAKGDIVVVSSLNAKNDFERLYPDSVAKTFVLHFAVTHPDFSKESFDNLLIKYQLSNHYFFAPNQFWKHKNHIVILKAIKHLKDLGRNILVAMSGKEDDYRNADNFKVLKEYINDNQLQDNIKLLGFIPRTEQLCLMQHATAIIQPSMFEGWSTVVEDAKALNKFLILSNIDVHKEQVSENVEFFSPNDASELADIILKYNDSKPKMKYSNYKSNILDFGKQFYKLIEL